MTGLAARRAARRTGPHRRRPARPADAARARGGAGGEVRQAQRVSSRDARHRSSAACCDGTAARCRRRRWCGCGANCSRAPPRCRARSRSRCASRTAAAGFTQAAREHFGALTPLRAYRSPAQAMAEVSAGIGRGGGAADAVGDRYHPRTPGGPRCCRRTSRGSTWWPAAVLGAAAGWRADRPGAGDRHHRTGSVRARPLAARPRTRSSMSAAPG